MRKNLLTPFSLAAVVALSSVPALSAVSKSSIARTPSNSSSIAFSCSAQEGGAGFDLVINSNGGAKAMLNQNGKTYSCPLKITKFTDSRKAKVPFVGVTLAREQACVPALPAAFSKTLKGNFALNLIKAGRKPASNVSFLSKGEDASCGPTNFRVTDFNALIKQWNGKSSRKKSR